ncbi:hypothetical protein ANN_21424 [Periplaneta americana]|uniref:Uncharacterized protein n=1 Tax=Periplaneta americana TaxID=6978 RepID=A0ABQ8SG37_PERAM|nr:hypothetical protein ANN_21424 [Periplaneta americana]
MARRRTNKLCHVEANDIKRITAYILSYNELNLYSNFHRNRFSHYRVKRKYDRVRRQYGIRPTLRDALGNDFNCTNAVLRFLSNTGLDKSQNVFSNESRFNLSYNDGRIRVRRYRGERKLRACFVE